MANPYREVVDGPVHRLSVRAGSSLMIRVGFPLIAIVYGGGFLPVILLAAYGREQGWSSATTAIAIAGALVALCPCALFVLWLFARGKVASHKIEVDRDRRVVRLVSPKGMTETGPDETAIPFDAVRSVYAFDGCVRIETEQKVHEAIDYFHRRTPKDAEALAKRIQELVVAETGRVLPRVRIEAGQRVESDDAYEAEAERETEAARQRER